jgi:hypothetical protein
MDHRSAGASPGGEKREAVLVEPVVPTARPGRAVEGLLHIDGDQHGVVIQYRHRTLLEATTDG